MYLCIWWQLEHQHIFADPWRHNLHFVHRRLIRLYKTKSTSKISWTFHEKFRLCCDDVILNKNRREPILTNMIQMLNCLHSLKWAFFAGPPNCSRLESEKYSSVTLDLFECWPNYLSKPFTAESIERVFSVISCKFDNYYVLITYGFGSPF